MNLRRFDKMPDDAHVWVYGFDRPLDATTRARATIVLDEFVKTWTSHEVPVAGAYEILEDRFLLLAGYCTDGISGCSTDSSVRVVKAIRNHIGVDGLDRSLVFFRDDTGSVQSLTRADFQKKVRTGDVGPDAIVFDTTIQTVAELRAGRFETTFEKSWHAKAFQR